VKKMTRSQKYAAPLLTSLLLATVALVACSQGTSTPATSATSTTVVASANLDDLGELDKGKKPPSVKQDAKFQSVQAKNRPAQRAPDNQLNKRVSGKIDTYSDSEEATSVSGYTFEYGTDTNGDGATNERAESNLTIAGLGDHNVLLEQDNFPVMSNQSDQLTVKDQTSGNTRVYSADQDLFRFSVKDGEAGIDIETLPDGSWLINGEAAANAEVAAQLAMKSPVIADASLHGLMLIYQVLKQADKLPVHYLVETLIPASCAYGTISFGDPKPLMKEIIKLKKEMGKTGK